MNPTVYLLLFTVDNGYKDSHKSGIRILIRMICQCNHSVEAAYLLFTTRLINVLLPGTALPIHRHKHTAETYVMLRGKMYVVFYNDLGAPVERILLDQAHGNYGVQIPRGQWHTIEVVEPSAILEVKEGPYAPLEPEDMMY